MRKNLSADQPDDVEEDFKIERFRIPPHVERTFSTMYALLPIKAILKYIIHRKGFRPNHICESHATDT
jgi:hypothetical protein